MVTPQLTSRSVIQSLLRLLLIVIPYGTADKSRQMGRRDIQQLFLEPEWALSRPNGLLTQRP